MVGTACESARLARLPVEALTSDGRRCSGVPQPRAAEEAAAGHEVDETGFARELRIGDQVVALDTIVELKIGLPGSSPDV